MVFLVVLLLSFFSLVSYGIEAIVFTISLWGDGGHLMIGELKNRNKMWFTVSANFVCLDWEITNVLLILFIFRAIFLFVGVGIHV